MSDLSQAIDSFERAVLDGDADLAVGWLDADCARLQVDPTVSSLDRDEWAAALRTEVVHGYEVLERFVHEDADAAAVLQQVRLSATVDGQDRNGTQTLTDVWRQRGEGWRLWRRHVVPDADLAAEQQSSEAAAARAAMARDVRTGDAPEPSKATVTEIAAVLAAIADAGEDPNALTMEEVEQYVQAFRALKDEA